MFSNCLSITSLNLTNLNTDLVENIALMFAKDSNLEFLDISSFVTLIAHFLILCFRIAIIY